MKLSEFGKELRRLRVQNSKTLADVSAKLNYSVAFLSAVERGAKTPSPKLVEAVEDLFALNQSERQALEISAQKSRKRLSIHKMRSEDASLFAIFAHQVSSMSGDQTALLEKAISNPKTFELLMQFAQKVLAEQERRQTAQLSFEIEVGKEESVRILLKRSFASHIGRSVPQLGKEKIARKASQIRAAISSDVALPFDIVLFLDDQLQNICDGYDYKVLDDKKFVAHLIARGWQLDGLNCVQAFTDPFDKEITLRECVYNAACKFDTTPDCTKARFTIAHEVGHALLHDDLYDAGEYHRDQPLYVNSEWQADVAARYMLLAPRSVDCFDTAREMASSLLVTQQCADQHWAEFSPGVSDRRQGRLF
jgi:transcriptional regulator with XRE-family HTH domain